MAQLPPKVPNIPHNWPNVGHQKAQPSWVDEFLDFSSARRVSHRRLVSDVSVSFDRLEEDQLMYIFSEDVQPNVGSGPVSSSNPSSPSDHNSVDEDKIKLDKQAAEVQSECKVKLHTGSNANANEPDMILDSKRVKRILANRQSAQRSRVRKLQYISELERSITALQTEVSALSPRVALLDHQRSVLTVGNSHLKQRLAALAQDKIFKDAHQEALRTEIERLRQVYHQQNLKKMAGPASEANSLRINKEIVS